MHHGDFICLFCQKLNNKIQIYRNLCQDILFYKLFRILVNKNNCIEIALSFEEVKQLPHFEKLSFRVNKKIFRAVDQEGQFALVKHIIQIQSLSCALKANVIYPVKGKWGL